jgi:hypothetical protein
VLLLEDFMRQVRRVFAALTAADEHRRWDRASRAAIASTCLRHSHIPIIKLDAISASDGHGRANLTIAFIFVQYR